MHRREFFQTSVIAALAGKVLSDVTLAQAQAPATAPAATAPAPTPRRLIMDAYSRHLHWLRTADEVAEAAIEMTCGGVNPTIQPYPGHIDPTKVAQELPVFVRTIQKHGLRVKQVRGGNATDVSAPNVEAMIGTMGQLGVTHYWIGTDNYDLSKPILPQLDAIKRKAEQFVKLNQKHGTTLMYHTRAGASSVGSVVWDLLYVMKDFDPRQVGFHWDTGHMSHHGSNTWELLMRTAGPYVVAMGWKDRTWEQDLGFLGEGGPYPGPQQSAAPAAGRGRGGRGRGAADAGRGAAGAGEAPADPGGGRAGAGAPAEGRGGQAEAAGEGGPPAGRGRGGRGGRGGGSRAFPLPLAGNTFARGGGWRSPYVPMGTGLVDLFRYATVLRDIGFDGPMELEAEYPNGGSQSGDDKLTLPREQVIGNLKRDILTIRAAFEQSGSGLAI
jgi:sugar phosphate isomerase/epimerase